MLRGAGRLSRQSSEILSAVRSLRFSRYSLASMARTRAATANSAKPATAAVAVAQLKQEIKTVTAVKARPAAVARPAKKQRLNPDSSTDPELAKPRRRRSKQPTKIVLKTEYDVKLATTEAEDEQVRPLWTSSWV